MAIFLCRVFLLISIFPFLGLASINSHSSNLTAKLFSKDFFDSGVCLQEAACIPLQNATCFGTTLPYVSTSIALAEDSVSQVEVQDNLALLRSIPDCWAVVQPLLCSVYMPKCENGSVYLPSQEMCNITQGPCKSVLVKYGWPSFLRCENKKLFPSQCRNPLQEVKFNESYKCVSPLVETDNPDNRFHEVKGCGIQCQEPFFSEEHTTHFLILILASVCFGMNVYAALTFRINWDDASNQFPGVVMFFINLCLATVCLFCLVLLIQFFPGAREEIVCSFDGTLQRRQPRSGEHLCSITFAFMYYFLMVSVMWFVILTYTLQVLFKQREAAKDIGIKKLIHFHCSAWGIPNILLMQMAITRVDHSGIGVCFFGYSNINMRIQFLFAPIGVAVIIGGFFLSRVLYTLVKLKGEVTNLQGKKTIRHFILKIGGFSAFTLAVIICTFACLAYDFLNCEDWDESFRNYIVCLAMNSADKYPPVGEPTKCALKSKTSMKVVYAYFSCLFAYGIGMSSFCVCTREALESWSSFCYKLREPAKKSSVAMKRHQLIAKAYQKPHEINHNHIFSSDNNSHDDPIDMSRHTNV